MKKQEVSLDKINKLISFFLESCDYFGAYFVSILTMPWVKTEMIYLLNLKDIFLSLILEKDFRERIDDFLKALEKTF